MELATSTPNNLVSSSSFSPSSTRIVRLWDHLKQSYPENAHFGSMIPSEPSVAKSELPDTNLMSDGTECYVKIMVHKKVHSPKSEKGIFAGYPLDQPLCYKVLICRPPHQLKKSAHVNFNSNNYLPSNILQVSSTADTLWLNTLYLVAVKYLLIMKNKLMLLNLHPLKNFSLIIYSSLMLLILP